MITVDNRAAETSNIKLAGENISSKVLAASDNLEAEILSSKNKDSSRINVNMDRTPRTTAKLN